MIKVGDNKCVVKVRGKNSKSEMIKVGYKNNVVKTKRKELKK